MYRNITEKEKKLLEKLIEKASDKFSKAVPENLIVRNLDDGQMGSLKF